MRGLFLSVFVIVLILAVPGGRLQADGPQDGLISARIAPGWTEPDGRRFAAVILDLAPGWKTYWRHPGETGIPPRFDYGGSRNVAAVTVHWPEPEVFTDATGLRSLGYAERMVLPLEIRPQRPEDPVFLSSRAAIGLCSEICLPVDLALSAELPARASPGAAKPVIAAALAAVPTGHDGTRHVRCEIVPITDGVRVTARIDWPGASRAEIVVMEPDRADLWVSQADLSAEAGALIATSEMVPPEGRPFAIDRSGLRFSLLGPDGMTELAGCRGD